MGQPASTESRVKLATPPNPLSIKIIQICNLLLGVGIFTLYIILIPVFILLPHNLGLPDLPRIIIICFISVLHLYIFFLLIQYKYSRIKRVFWVNIVLVMFTFVLVVSGWVFLAEIQCPPKAFCAPIRNPYPSGMVLLSPALIIDLASLLFLWRTLRRIES